MAKYIKVGEFALGKNQYKNGEKDPEYTGTYVGEDGVQVQLGAWIRTNGKTGEKFFSGTATKKIEDDAPIPAKETLADIEDIPF